MSEKSEKNPERVNQTCAYDSQVSLRYREPLWFPDIFDKFVEKKLGATLVPSPQPEKS